MNRQRIRFLGTLAACFLVFGAIGVLLGRVLRGHPTLALVTLGLALLGGGWARWRWRLQRSN